MVIKMSMTNIKRYSELITIPDYIERFKYLQLDGKVGVGTFDHDRWINQQLYGSYEWRKFRREIIMRDNCCDMAHMDYEIHGKVIIHHINPITYYDIEKRDYKIFDPENVICVSMMTHNAIHYSDTKLLMTGPIERTPNDTCPWRQS